MRAALAEINLGAVRKNLALVQAKAPGSRVLAIVKADGYGHGLEAIAQALAGAPQPADAFGVASIDDAARLRASGISARIVLLSGFDEISDLVAIQELELDSVIHHEDQISMLERAPNIASARPIRAWLKLDSGMRRLGFFADQLRQAIALYRQVPTADLASPGNNSFIRFHSKSLRFLRKKQKQFDILQIRTFPVVYFQRRQR